MNNVIKRELIYGARNYMSENVCINRGLGVYLWDTNNKKYLDFISAYSAVNQGHCHPRLLHVMNQQASKLTLTSRALYNDVLGNFMQKMCNTFGYDNVLPMNTGVEAGETAIKIARKWGYNVKKVEYNKAVNLFCRNNFWGRTLAASSSSSDPSCYQGFGPYMRGFEMVEYNNILSLENKLKSNPNIVSIMLEPIQGEAGIIIPDSGYIGHVRYLCDKYDVLMIADEVQTGMGRTGGMTACMHDNVRPDILILGKALSGGIMPVSVVLADYNIMNSITPGTHGSTFGGNPLGAAIAMEAIDITIDEDLCQNSETLGKYFRDNLETITTDYDIVKDVRGRGLMNAMEFNNKNITNDFIKSVRDDGLLTKSTHDTTIRLAPPLVITKEQIDESLKIIDNNLKKLS